MKAGRSLTSVAAGFVAASVIAGVLATEAGAQGADPAVTGSWSAPFDVGDTGIHSSVLPNGRVLLFSYPDQALGSDASIWDPATGGLSDVSLQWPRDIFCAGHSFLPDGRLFITGGHVHGARYGLGVENTDIFDPATGLFEAGPALAEARWYPTNVGLGDGRVLVFGGYKDNDANIRATSVEAYDPAANRITQLPSTANKGFGNYPRLHLLANGRIAWVNISTTQMFNPATSAWTASAKPVYGGRGESGSSVLLPGSNRILSFGGPNGAGGATATAEIVDYAAATPAWRATGSLRRARLWANGVLLPDGKVLAVGGGGGGAYTNPVYDAEMFDPATGTWTLMAAQQAPRVYHSTVALLPDGRVLSAGQDSGSYRTTAEIYSPPYLFKGPRPVIAAAPASVGYGERFSVSTPDASAVARVVLIRPASVTHSLHQDQRSIELPFTVSGGTLEVSAPAGGNAAPPGPYMLFLVTSTGVPSVASWLDVGEAQSTPAPAISGFDPTSGDPGTVVRISGSNLTGATAVTFNGVAASEFSVVSGTLVSATVPAAATTGPIRVTTPGGTAASGADFIVGGPPPPSTPYRDAVLADAPAGYWRLGETSGKALDEMSNGGAGIYNGGVTRGVPGALATESDLAAQFDGTDDYVSIPDNNALDVGDSYTLEAWVQRGAVLGTTQRFMHKGAGPASFGFGANNKLVLIPGGPGATPLASSTMTITDSAWHHVVATKNGASVRIYVDGVDATAPGTNSTSTSNTSALNIGRSAGGNGYFAGAIDEVAVYPRALGAERVESHYRAGTTGAPAQVSATSVADSGVQAFGVSRLAATGSPSTEVGDAAGGAAAWLCRLDGRGHA
jgi:hypothetical protein